MSDKEVKDVEPWRRVRYLIVFLVTAGFFVIYMMRTSLSIAIVAMTNNSTKNKYETFDWDLSTQGTILSSFFWGYILTNIPGAILVQKYGSRWVFLVTTALGGVATLLIPVGAEYGGWGATCALRIIQGASQGPFFSCFQTCFTKWTSQKEKARCSGIAFSGAILGITLVLASGGILADSDGGWPAIFYVCGSLSLAWCVLWFFLGYNSPADHPFVTAEEKRFIESQYISAPTKSTFYIPWMSLAKSAPLWALCCAYCADCWGFYMLLTEMPTYINNILQYDIADNGFLSALPFLALCIFTALFGWLSDLVSKHVPWAKGWNRRMFTVSGFLTSAISLGVLTAIDRSEKDVAIVLLVIGVTGTAAGFSGFQINQMDLSPNYTSILMGITNTVGNTISAIVPIAVSAMISDENDVNGWYIVFWSSSAVYVLGCIIYVLFGSEEIQPWNDAMDSSSQSRDEKYSHEEVEVVS